MTDKDVYSLFMETLDVINEALERHGDQTPWKQMLGGADKVFGGRNIGVGVYADDPSEPFDFFTVRLLDGKFELVARGKDAPQIPWRVSRAYLDKVSSNRDEYVANPLKLDWDWLLATLPDGVRALMK